MPQLIVVSLLWAFSFGLVKQHLVGLDSALVATARLGLALVLFLPLLRLRGVTPKLAARLAIIGAVQFGVMYFAYNLSFQHLQAHEVALFTLTTPVFVTLFADAYDRTLRLRSLGAALLAVVGAAVVVFGAKEIEPTLLGLLLLQGSNAAFALGQVMYRRLRHTQPDLRDRDIFALPYAGGFIVVLAALMIRQPSIGLTGPQALTLLYLGGVASGLGFFLWNQGAAQVNAGMLAVMNNAKVPLGIAASLLFFGEHAYPPAVVASLALLVAAAILAHRE
jgi:drug/metabolite transporter (DMT)-like permease